MTVPADPPGPADPGEHGRRIGAAVAAVWAALPDPGPLPRHRIEPPEVEVASAFDVVTAGAAPVAAAVLAAVAVAADRGLPPPATARRDRGTGAAPGPGSVADSAPDDGIVVSTDHALAASTAHVRVDGVAPPTWAPLSGRYATVDDRFVQIHANFPHHAAGVAGHLGVAQEREAVANAIATRRGEELETELIGAGMICALYRSLDEWAAHPHAMASAQRPVLDLERLDGAAPIPWPTPTPTATLTATGDAGPPRALDGIRVLDCSRVLAGPACGQMLAAHGADVLRVGAAHLPSVEGAVLATGFGKRNTFVDLDTTEGRRRFEALLARADVMIDGYRPGALASRGLTAERIAELRPGVVLLDISAFGWEGPWAGRRGFDSIVQTTTGIAVAGGIAAGRDEPVHLPFQAFDYATGHLAAFAALGLLRHQRRHGGTWRARLSLLAARNWMVELGGPWPFRPTGRPDVEPWLHTVDSPLGRVEAVRPVAGYWDRPPTPLGDAEPAWLRS